MFVQGNVGQRYAIRLTNRTAKRVEVVVTVDGRDVISGDLGNYRRQRGYVIGPFSAITVDGFRQSLDQVAAFRFSTIGDSYSGRRGTPENSGVIGFAVFAEKDAPRRRHKPIAVGPEPFPATAGGPTVARAEDSPEPFPASPGTSGATATAPVEKRQAAEEDNEVTSAREAEPSASAKAADSAGGFAPPPEPVPQLGTAYGESRQSAVHEVEFKRRRRGKPDEIFALHYDSPEGLRQRGVLPADGPVAFEAQAFARPPF
jgi:hypothetical protein